MVQWYYRPSCCQETHNKKRYTKRIREQKIAAHPGFGQQDIAEENMSEVKETETKKNKKSGRRAEGGAQSPPKGRKTEKEVRAQVPGKVVAKIGKVPYNTEQQDQYRKEKKSQG